MDEVENLNRMLDQSYQILCALYTDATIHIEGQDPILPGDPRRNEMIIDVSGYLSEYTRLNETYELPDWIIDKHRFLMTLIRWLMDPSEDLIIELELADDDYDSADFGEDVAKSGCTAEEIRQFIVKKPLNKFRLPIQQTSCTICLEDFEATEEVSRLNCSHVYHDLCLGGWLKNNRTCPLCVTDISEAPPKRKRQNRSNHKMDVDETTTNSNHELGLRRSKRLRGLAPDP